MRTYFGVKPGSCTKFIDPVDSSCNKCLKTLSKRFSCATTAAIDCNEDNKISWLKDKLPKQRSLVSKHNEIKCKVRVDK